MYTAHGNYDISLDTSVIIFIFRGKLRYLVFPELSLYNFFFGWMKIDYL